ncbi:MAG: cytidine deaminase [Gammaproteobacteria bacterium]|nr:cytidine deaminase [Gammaproteobacteria bacterium]
MTTVAKQLVQAAKQVRTHAHAPYSGYRVGAALIDDKGNLHTGCNVENAAFPEGTCAEANAIGAMVAAGGRVIRAIAAVGGRDSIDYCTPCGGCRQSILEFSDSDTQIILVDEKESTQQFTIDELLPAAFRFK